MNNLILLEGTWSFQTDPQRLGVKEKWFLHDLPLALQLPGTMEENGFGNIPAKRNIRTINHTLHYSGWAWYKREIEISQEWAGKHITLFLERCQWETHVWLDDIYLGMRNSLVAPHEYDLTETALPGRHVLTMMIDNSNLKASDETVEAACRNDLESKAAKDKDGRDINIHLATRVDMKKKLNCGLHHVSFIWNGIVGNMEIRARDAVWIEHVDIFPHVQSKEILFDIEMGNITGKQFKGDIEISCTPENDDCCTSNNAVVFETEIPSNRICRKRFILRSGDLIKLWDEFNPDLYKAKISLKAHSQNNPSEYTDILVCTFGVRSLEAKGRDFVLNGRKLFLRGTLEGMAFPNTGYPPTDVNWWVRVFRIMKKYGLNHMRMHTLCPPRAAFIAADRVGILIQAELPGTSCPTKDEDPEVTEYLTQELKRMLREYGNHPSLCFVSMGNEQLVVEDKEFLVRHQDVLTQKVRYGQEHDPRHLYTCTSHPYTEGRVDDYFIAATKDEHVLNGIRWGGPDPRTKSRFCTDVPDTDVDYEKGICEIDRPIITHEVGQWAVYPNLKEMYKYVGPIKPRNFEIIAESLARKGMLDQADDFVKASGRLSAILYKEEIESALRTRGLGGFQLLDIHDYPGQGTSTVGLLDVFWDSKGILTAEEFRQFCCETVPLLRMKKYVWTNAEAFTGNIEVAHYGKTDIPNAIVEWSIKDEKNRVLQQGAYGSSLLKAGEVSCTGKIEFKLQDVMYAQKLSIEVGIVNTEYKNRWNIWVYPEIVDELENENLLVFKGWDEGVVKALEQGKDVLLVHTPKESLNAIPGVFTTAFWNGFMKKQEGTMGLLCDPEHPMFVSFPTEFHTNWHWWDIIMNSSSIILDETPFEYRPVVQIIDGIHGNRRMGLIFEAMVGRGRLVVCAADILNNLHVRPVARQLKYSILKYMSGGSFTPEYCMKPEMIKRLLL